MDGVQTRTLFYNLKQFAPHYSKNMSRETQIEKYGFNLVGTRRDNALKGDRQLPSSITINSFGCRFQERF